MTGTYAARHGNPRAATWHAATAPCAIDGCMTGAGSPDLDVCTDHVPDRLGITYRQLDYWANQGYLHPTVANPGSGIGRHWPAAELEIARKIGFLVRSGLPLRWAARFVRDGWPRAELAPGVVVEVREP